MSRRWPLGAFVALAAVTVGAFFFVQHLKVATPLINGFPAPFPRTIDPVAGGVCTVRTHAGRRPVSFRRMSLSFYLQNRADDVDAYVVDGAGDRVRQIGFGVHMGVGRRHSFWWDGRLSDGAVAPDGAYEIEVELIHQARVFVISNQSTGAAALVRVDTAVPHPVVTVSPATVAAGQPVAIRFTGAGAGGLGRRILVYRVRPGRAPRLVASYGAGRRRGASVWDATIRGRPAPRGTYLIAVRATNASCTTGTSPVTVAAAPRALVTVSDG